MGFKEGLKLLRLSGCKPGAIPEGIVESSGYLEVFGIFAKFEY